MNPDATDKAIAELWFRDTFVLGERKLIVACLVREQDWRPLSAPWWRGKEAYIIGSDLDGNFFLRHCDGSVRFWDHGAQADTVIAPSVREFFRRLQKSDV
jgi:hypothetical protein